MLARERRERRRPWYRPSARKLGRKVVYRRADLADWLGARRVANTTQAAVRLPRRLDDAAPQSAAREINE